MSEQLIQTPGVFGENGNLLLERELGQGGMGGVYMGRDKMLDRPVAVKVMLKEYGEDAEFVGKFKKEAQACARLIHPNIAQIYYYGIFDGMPYMAMELCSGGSLFTIMASNPGKTDVARVIKICQQTAQALQCASDQGCVHGDVKPENILLDANGNAKLVDFGLAAMQKETDEIWGTPYYISPEKVKKEPIDFRADMYSLGGTLYHALTGVAPFEADDLIEVVKKRFTETPRKPSKIRPDLTPAIDNLVMKMLAFNKEDRFPSFEALLEEFKHVLTTGLTNDASAAESAAAAAPAVKKTTATTAGKRMMVRGRRTTMMKRTSVTKATSAVHPKPDDAEADEGKVSEETAAEEGEIKTDAEEDEEESGGNLGLKVVGVVVGVIVVIGLVVGGLIWYRVSAAKEEARQVQQQIVNGIGKARDAIRETVASAVKFADDFDVFSAKATTECEKATDGIRSLLPAEIAPLLKPASSKELDEAIASTNEAPAVAAAPAVETPPPANTNAAPATATNAAPAAAAAPAAKPATPPAAKDAKAAAPAAKDAKPAAKPAAAAKPAEKKADPKAAPASATKAPEKPAPEVPAVVGQVNELWERAYKCQACAIRIRHAVRQIVKKGAEADAIKDETKESMQKLAELSRTLVDMLDQVKTSKDVETVKSGISYIRSKGESLVQQTTKQLRIEKLQRERKEKEEAAAAAEAAAKEKAEAERKAKVEAETTEAKNKFDMIAAQGSFRQLDWSSAIRQLNVLKESFTTPEGQLAADLEIRKVNDMKKVQDIFVKNMGNHVFKAKPKNCKVKSVNAKEIVFLKPDGKSSFKVTWQKFYKDYPGYVNELINLYVIKGRENAKPKLSLRDWADAMTGAALTMRLLWTEVNGAAEKANQLAQDSVKGFPEYVKVAKEIFPDLEFAAAAEEE